VLALAITLGVCVLASLSMSGVAMVAALRRSDRLVSTAAELSSLAAKLSVLTAAYDASSKALAEERSRSEALESEIAAGALPVDGARGRVVRRIREAAAAAGAAARAEGEVPDGTTAAGTIHPRDSRRDGPAQ
jgi:hypothetical protein